MAKNKIGRNEPCPCGSGKKYKRCCLKKDRETNRTPNDPDIFSELREALSGQEFGDLDEAQDFIDSHYKKQNQMTSPEFHGLSPEQMHRMLHYPFESPDVLKFSEQVSNEVSAPLFVLFKMLAEEVPEKGLKPTAKGNLPRNLCREIALNYYGEKEFHKRMSFTKINKEQDFMDLHVTRLVMELSGVLRKDKGKFFLSKKCQALLNNKEYGQIYRLLFDTYVNQFN